jgi:hypothetical protein
MSDKQDKKATFGDLVRPDAHVRVKGKDIDEMIEANPCHEVYAILENCIGENDRDWRKCQNEVKALRECTKKNQPNTVEEEDS